MPYRQRIRQHAFVQKYISFYDSRLKANFHLPMMHIRIVQNGQSMRTDALLDSGATVTYIPIEIMDMLGVQFPGTFDSADSVGAGGQFDSYRVSIDRMDILKNQDHLFQFENLKVLVPKSPDAIPYTILGRDSIFHHFDITFREREQKVVLRS